MLATSTSGPRIEERQEDMADFRRRPVNRPDSAPDRRSPELETLVTGGLCCGATSRRKKRSARRASASFEKVIR